MTNKLSSLHLLAAAGALAIVPLAGCGGGSTDGDTGGVTTQAADPYIYAYGDNGFSTYAADEVSSFGTNMVPATPTTPAIPFSDANPAATDTAYFTFASANSAPTSTESGAGPFETGIGDGNGGTFTPGSYVAGVPAGSSTVAFRAQGVQGQLANRTVPDITAATLAVGGGAATTFQFPAYDQDTAAGPFAASPYYLVTSFAAYTASGIISAVASITDSANRTTSTTFQTVVLAGTSGAIAISSAGTVAVAGATPTATFGPDSNGETVYIYILPASATPYAYTVTTGTGTAAATYDGTATVEAGEVYVAPTAAATSSARHRHAKLAHKIAK